MGPVPALCHAPWKEFVFLLINWHFPSCACLLAVLAWGWLRGMLREPGGVSSGWRGGTWPTRKPQTVSMCLLAQTRLPLPLFPNAGHCIAKPLSSAPCVLRTRGGRGTHRSTVATLGAPGAWQRRVWGGGSQLRHGFGLRPHVPISIPLSLYLSPCPGDGGAESGRLVARGLIVSHCRGKGEWCWPWVTLSPRGEARAKVIFL